jgi:hypothetical protein
MSWLAGFARRRGRRIAGGRGRAWLHQPPHGTRAVAPPNRAHCEAAGSQAASHLPALRRGTPHRDRRLCDTCLADTQAEQFDAFSGTGLAALERLKREGLDPAHGGQAAKKRGQATSDRKREIAEWEARYGQLVDLTAFTREILPLIQDVALSRLAGATGLSLRYVSLIRRGQRVPHPKHWSSFRECREAEGMEAPNGSRR